MKRLWFLLILTIPLLSLSKAYADIRLPSIIGDHMVLQQNSVVKLWGWADPNEKITIKCDWDTSSFHTTGSSGAQWEISLRTPSSGGAHIINFKGNNNIIVSDVVFGEVWLCSGQSNMEMNINWGLPQYFADTANANNNEIRFFYIPKTTAEYPQNDVKARWVVSTAHEMKSFSTAGYFFGQRLQETLHVPIGLINASWGGTPAETWTPSPIVESDLALRTAAAKLNKSTGWPVTPGYAFNAMIHPLTNYNIAGVIWYQGESNVGTWSTYQSLFTSMIDSWRKRWEKEFPFYFVQIAPFAGYGNSNDGLFLREAQTKSTSYPNTGMVLTSDLVDNINDIHPKMKKEVGYRLANYALAETYGKKDLPYKIPVYKSMKIEKDKIRIYFDNASGLTAKNPSPTEFYISGEDKLFLPAKTKIEKNTVVVWNSKIKGPVAVRFGYTNDAMPDLHNTEGLPVNLFRTDNWDDITIKK